METSPQQFEQPIAGASMQLKVAYIGVIFEQTVKKEIGSRFDLMSYQDVSIFEKKLSLIPFIELPDALIIEIDDAGYCFTFIEGLKKQRSLEGIIIILLARYDRFDWKARALALKVHDYYSFPFHSVNLNERIKFLIKFRIIKPWFNDPDTDNHTKEQVYQMPWSKRAFDIIASFIALLILSPLLLVIGILIRLGSAGPVIYRSKRVGAGYKVFDFYKFRSMQSDSDKQISALSQLNQYKSGVAGKSAFLKIVNDPRVTKIGGFLRKTSLDELPQLFNILTGDMSFVGNRPLPLYEAEQLTSNQWSMRFLGPAGLTGLWQISKRGKSEVSELERKELDNFYASQQSFWLDLKIILKTFPALIQKENV